MIFNICNSRWKRNCRIFVLRTNVTIFIINQGKIMNNIFLKLLDRKEGNIYLSLFLYIWGPDLYDCLFRSPLGCHRGPQEYFQKWHHHLSFLLAGPKYQLFPDLVNVNINHSVSQARTPRTKLDSSKQSIYFIDNY